jgi:predicted dehydrogenase
MKFGVGVIGATGFIGTPYRWEIRESPADAEIVALCARRQDLLDSAGAENGASLVTNHWREVVAHPDVNLVIAATPDALHHEAVMACAAAGKHVLCEKPVGLRASSAGSASSSPARFTRSFSLHLTGCRRWSKSPEDPLAMN